MFIYDENETMKTIGKHTLKVTDDARKGIFEILNAHQKHEEYGMIQMAVDLYTFGYIHGKNERGRSL